MTDSENPYEVRSTSWRESQSPELNIEIYPGFAIRALARILDQVLSIGFAFSTGVVLFSILMIQDPGIFESGNPEAAVEENPWINWLSGIAAYTIYHSLSELSGASVGKLLCGLRVLTAEGLPCSLVHTFKRSLVFPVDAFFFGIVAYSYMKDSAKQQRLGDRWAQTMVVRNKDLPAGYPSSVLKILVLNVAAAVAYGATILAFLLPLL